MKKFKFLFLIFALSGCSVEYNLNIDKNINLLETINITAQNEEEFSKIRDYNGNLPTDIEIDDPSVIDKKVKDVEYYDIEKNNKKIKFKYNYDLEKFNNNVFTNSCYEYVTTTQQENKLILSTSKKFSCFDKYTDLEDVTITLTSKYELIETNADIVERNKYTWNINNTNSDNKGIYLSLDTSKENLTFLEKLLRGDYFNIFTLSILILIIGYIVFICFKKYSEKVDEI